jgi:hypothetical protein
MQLAAGRGGSITGQNNVFLLDIVGNPNLRSFKIRQSSNGGSSFTDAFVLDSAAAATFSGAIAIGNTVNTVSPTSPNRTMTIVIGGTTYYLHAKTTND